VARLKTQRATSAGGIVVRVRDGRTQLVVGMRRRARGVTWTLPKGTPRPGETLEETAVREVGEETGLVVAIRRPVGSIRYSFSVEDARIDKTVHYFLMEAIGGHLAGHDAEFARVRWVDLDAAAVLLTFETERELVARVGRLLRTERPSAPIDRALPADAPGPGAGPAHRSGQAGRTGHPPSPQRRPELSGEASLR
jgi:8-oxo-dGTP pyrophosphatase MutT (NUDIX family)